MKINPIVVIGGGAAGAATAAGAKRLSPQTDVIILEKSTYISVGVCEFPYVLSGEISDPDKLIFYNAESFRKEKGVEVFYNCDCKVIDWKNHTIEFTDLNSGKTAIQSYSKLIIASGSEPTRLPGLPLNFSNVFYLKQFPDLINITRFLDSQKPQNIVIAGSGYLGLELADSFTKRGLSVKILEKADRVFPAGDKEFSLLIAKVLDAKNIECLKGSGQQSFFGDGDRLNKIKLKSGRVLDCDALFVCAGFQPNSSLAKLSGIKTSENGAIVTYAFMRTSVPDVYAAGDSIQIKNLVSNKYAPVFLAPIARETGYIAAQNAVGKSSRFEGTIAPFSVRVFDNYFASTGLTEQAAEASGFVTKSAFGSVKNLVHVMPEAADVAGKIVINALDKRILGASFFGGKEVSGLVDIITLSIKNKMTYHQLAETEFNYTPALSPFNHILPKLIRQLESKK